LTQWVGISSSDSRNLVGSLMEPILWAQRYGVTSM
jgi:hypothetical protein